MCPCSNSLDHPDPTQIPMSVFASGLTKLSKSHQEFHTKRFGDAQTELWKGMAELFADRDDVKKVSNQIQIIASQPLYLGQFVSEWHNALVMEPPGGVSYGKAFKRITSRPATYYDCAAYRDHKVLFTNELLVRSFQCDLVELFEDARSEASRKNCFEIIDVLNDAALAVAGAEALPRPSREELAANISKSSVAKKAGARGDVSLTAGMLRDIVASVSASAHATAPEREALGALCDRILPAGAKTTSFPVKLVQQHWAALPDEDRADAAKLLAVEHELCTAELRAVVGRMDAGESAKFTGAVQQFLSLEKIAGGISTGLLRAVQDELGDMEGLVGPDGGVDMSKLDMQKLVPNLMQKINPDEIQDMASNIGTMLPEIQKMAGQQGMDVNAVMKQTMGAVGGAGGGAPDMAALASMLGGMGKKP